MTDPNASSSAPAATRERIALSSGEFFGLTLAVWIGGVFILTLLPYLLVPRVGGPLAIAGSYLVFFLAWQPIQVITQRTLGVRAAFIRMMIFVIGAASAAWYLRQLLPTLGAS